MSWINKIEIGSFVYIVNIIWQEYDYSLIYESLFNENYSHTESENMILIKYTEYLADVILPLPGQLKFNCITEKFEKLNFPQWIF